MIQENVEQGNSYSSVILPSNWFYIIEHNYQSASWIRLK
jgi:hypothetical protein